MPRSTSGIPREVLAQREAQAWTLRQKFYTHQRIADEMGLERSTVTKILQRVTKRTLTKLGDDILEKTAAQVEQLEYVADEAMQAWHRSKEAQKNVAKRTVSRPGRFRAADKSEDILVQTSDNDGDPRYLDAAMRALGEVRKLTGMNAPQRTEVSGPNGGPIQTEETDNLTDDQRRAKFTALRDIAAYLAATGESDSGAGTGDDTAE